MKELKVFKCEVHYGIMALSYGIRFVKITAYSKAEAMRIAEKNTDNFKRCKVEQVLPAAPDAVHGAFERLMG